MIVIDTSALMAVAQDEPEAPAVAEAMARGADLLISAATLTEVLIVSGLRGVGRRTADWIDDLKLVVEPLTPSRARSAAAAYARWGKGVHQARLNYGDCFAYALAQEFACPLLYVGDDFARTDVKSALGA